MQVFGDVKPDPTKVLFIDPTVSEDLIKSLNLNIDELKEIAVGLEYKWNEKEGFKPKQAAWIKSLVEILKRKQWLLFVTMYKHIGQINQNTVNYVESLVKSGSVKGVDADMKKSLEQIVKYETSKVLPFDKTFLSS